VIDPKTGKTEITARYDADMHACGWDDEGRLVLSALFLTRIFHKASDFSRPTCVCGKNRLPMLPFSGSAAQQGVIASYVKQKCRF